MITLIDAEQLRGNDHTLAARRYIVIEEIVDEEPFDDKMKRLTSELATSFAESEKANKELLEMLSGLGYGINF